jgi:hypothetical protein
VDEPGFARRVVGEKGKKEYKLVAPVVTLGKVGIMLETATGAGFSVVLVF